MTDLNGSALYAYAPITKAEAQEDGTLLVSCRITSEAIDGDNEILDYEASKAAVGDWMAWANVREQHTASAVGKALSATPDDDARVIDGTIRVVDPIAVKKTLAGVYQGVSVGGRRLAVASEKVGGRDVRRVTKWSMAELSLVDRPSNPDARLVLAKRDPDEEEDPMDDETTAEPVEVEAPTEAAEPTEDAPAPEAEKAAAPEDIAKDATADLMSATYLLRCLADLIAAEADEVDDVALLRHAQADLAAFVAAEAGEIGTPEDAAEAAAEPEAVMEMAAEPADLRKMIDDAVAAALAAVAPAPTEPPPAEPAEEQTIEKAITALGPVVRPADMEAMEARIAGRLTAQEALLAKIAAQPAPGGPVRYAPDRGMAPGVDTDGLTPLLKAQVLTEEALHESDPGKRQDLQLRAAAARIEADRR